MLKNIDSLVVFLAKALYGISIEKDTVYEISVEVKNYGDHYVRLVWSAEGYLFLGEEMFLVQVDGGWQELSVDGIHDVAGKPIEVKLLTTGDEVLSYVHKNIDDALNHYIEECRLLEETRGW